MGDSHSGFLVTSQDHWRKYDGGKILTSQEIRYCYSWHVIEQLGKTTPIRQSRVSDGEGLSLIAHVFYELHHSLVWTREGGCGEFCPPNAVFTTMLP